MSYEQGFIEKCAQYGIDPVGLIKEAKRGDYLLKLLQNADPNDMGKVVSRWHGGDVNQKAFQKLVAKGQRGTGEFADFGKNNPYVAQMFAQGAGNMRAAQRAAGGAASAAGRAAPPPGAIIPSAMQAPSPGAVMRRPVTDIPAPQAARARGTGFDMPARPKPGSYSSSYGRGADEALAAISAGGAPTAAAKGGWWSNPWKRYGSLAAGGFVLNRLLADDEPQRQVPQYQMAPYAYNPYTSGYYSFGHEDYNPYTYVLN